jgi:hypothetical protein
MIALGTHQPMSEEAICQRLDISLDQRRSDYAAVGFINHEWDTPAALQKIGVISESEISELSGGLFAMDVPVEINTKVLGYDRILICGPVFPHEVVGFSGGNKYLFPPEKPTTSCGNTGPQIKIRSYPRTLALISTGTSIAKRPPLSSEISASEITPIF